MDLAISPHSIVVISTINAGILACVISSRKDDESLPQKFYRNHRFPSSKAIATSSIQAVHDALYASRFTPRNAIVAASTTYNWNSNFGDIATIWRGGCIIIFGAKFLKTASSRLNARNPPACTIYCWTNISPISSPGRSITGALRFRLPSIMRDGACFQRLLLIGIQLSFRALAGKFIAGATRSLWRPYLRARR